MVMLYMDLTLTPSLQDFQGLLCIDLSLVLSTPFKVLNIQLLEGHMRGRPSHMSPGEQRKLSPTLGSS